MYKSFNRIFPAQQHHQKSELIREICYRNHIINVILSYGSNGSAHRRWQNTALCMAAQSMKALVISCRKDEEDSRTNYRKYLLKPATSKPAAQYRELPRFIIVLDIASIGYKSAGDQEKALKQIWNWTTGSWVRLFENALHDSAQ